MIQKEIGKTLAKRFVEGFAVSTGMSIGQELYKLYEAIDPLYDVRMKMKKAKRKKRFDKMIAQTDLKKGDNKKKLA